MRKLGASLGWELPTCTGNLCETLGFMVQYALQSGEDETLEVLALRLSSNDASACFSAQIMELDAAIDVMDVRDARKFAEEKVTAPARQKTRSDFARVYTARRAAARDAEMQGARKGRHQKKQPARKPLPSRIEQTSARRFIPRAHRSGEG